MTRPTLHPVPTTILAVLLPVLFLPAAAGAAQEVSSRYRVLAPPLAALDGADEDFGEEVSERVREAIDRLPRHAPFEGRELRDALRKYDLDEEELSAQECAKGRQLAGLLSIPLVMCGSYSRRGDAMQVAASFISPGTGDYFEIDAFTASSAGEAAERIVGEFERYTQALSSTVYCQQDVTSEQWASALERCNTALAANPNGKTALYLKGTALWRLDSLEAALRAFDRVLALDPMHQEAYQAAGIVATHLGRRDVARGYFTELLKLNPGDAAIRMAVANDMAQAGDPAGALAVVEAGLSGDSVELPLYEYAGRLALAAAIAVTETCDGCELIPEARALYEKSYEYLYRVFDARGAESDSAMVGNLAVVLTRLGRNADVVTLAERVRSEQINVDANFWTAHADALHASGDLSAALASLDRAEQKDSTARVYGRRAAWLIEGGQVEAAIAPARRAVQRGELDPSTVARLIAGTAYNQKAKIGQHDAAIAMYEVAAGFAEDAESIAMVSFFHGYSLLRQAIAVQEPGTLESARRSLPMFQRARALIDAGEAYPDAASSRPSLLEDIDAYIATQEALIRRGR